MKVRGSIPAPRGQFTIPFYLSMFRTLFPFCLPGWRQNPVPAVRRGACAAPGRRRAVVRDAAPRQQHHAVATYHDPRSDVVYKFPAPQFSLDITHVLHCGSCRPAVCIGVPVLRTSGASLQLSQRAPDCRTHCSAYRHGRRGTGASRASRHWHVRRDSCPAAVAAADRHPKARWGRWGLQRRRAGGCARAAGHAPGRAPRGDEVVPARAAALARLPLH